MKDALKQKYFSLIVPGTEVPRKKGCKSLQPSVFIICECFAAPSARNFCTRYTYSYSTVAGGFGV